MTDMRQYVVVYKTAAGGGELKTFATSRDDAIEFTRRHVRVPLKLKSAKLTDRAKSKGGRPCKAKPEPHPLVTEQPVPEAEAFAKLLQQAYDRVQSTPFSGIAIASYLKLVMADDTLLSSNLITAIWHVIRAVETYEDKLVQRRKL